ncbi:hypothetical protein PFISCL1PPCAC_28579, partial [Pristionchus fissidentatus]
ISHHNLFFFLPNMRLSLLISSILAVSTATTHSPPKGSGVIVSIENGAKGLNVGSGDRAQFNLAEQYVPLSRAGKAVGDLDALRVRLAGVKNVQREQAPNSIVDAPEDFFEAVDAPNFPTPVKLMDGEWQEWMSWSGCSNGFRTRIRACVASKPAWRVQCAGDAKESTPCFDTIKKTAVASDPWTIEKEITGRA